MIATQKEPASVAASHWSKRAADPLDLVEVQAAVLVRNFELLRRRGDFYGDLDQAGYLLLRTLEAIGPADINTLAAALGLAPSTAGRQVAAMQQTGLIDRTPAPSDRRRSIVTPTPEGRERANRVRRQRRERLMDLFEGWTEAELRTLGDSFARCNRAVAEHYLGAEDPSTSAEQSSDKEEDRPTGRRSNKTTKLITNTGISSAAAATEQP